MRASPIAVFFCCLTLVCEAGEDRLAIRMADEVLTEAACVKFDYQQHMSAAVAGDETAVHDLFLFTRHTDAASALGHGVALVDLFQTIGEEMPARVAKTLSADDKRRLTLMMQAGVAYGFKTAPEEWTQRFSQMSASLRPIRFTVFVWAVAGALVVFVALLTIRRRLQLRHVLDV